MRDRSMALLMTFTLIAGSFLSPASASRAFVVKGWQIHSTPEWEEKFRSIPQAERIKENMRVLSAEPHHIGSPAGRKNAEWMRDQMKLWGLDAAIEEFDVLFPTPRERVLEMIAPEKFQARLKEPAIAEDSDSGDPNQLPTYNAYSGDGDVTAPLLYDRALRALAQSGALPADLKAMNALLYQSERVLLSEAGLPRRDWFKHQVYAPGFYTGYGVKTLPGVREAIEQKNWSEASEQVKVVSKALDAMVAKIAGATRKLSGQ